jgi:hypothetical protein
MARRNRSRRLLVDEAKSGLDRFKGEVMRQQGYAVSPDQPNRVKFEVARKMGIPLEEGYNGNLSTAQAGKIGGQIGGTMVREMIRLAQQKLVESYR